MGQLDRPDIVALSVMGTAFSHQNPVAVLQMIQRVHAVDGCL